MKESDKQKIVPTHLPPAITIRRGFISEITIHQITEEELETLAHGYPDSIYLSFANILLSVASSLLISLLTTVVSDRVFIVFVIFTVLGYIFGILFLILWRKTRQSMEALVKKIKDRLPPEGTQEVWTLVDDLQRRE